MNDNTKQIIEINGVKMEIDTRFARRIDTLVVGSKIKLLQKQAQYGTKDVKVHPGVVVGFEPFADLPTIVVCYLEIDYSSASLKFAYINSASAEKYDLIASIDDELPVAKQDVLSKMDRELERKRAEMEDLQSKRDYFLRHFNTYFEQATA